MLVMSAFTSILRRIASRGGLWMCLHRRPKECRERSISSYWQLTNVAVERGVALRDACHSIFVSALVLGSLLPQSDSWAQSVERVWAPKTNEECNAPWVRNSATSSDLNETTK